MAKGKKTGGRTRGTPNKVTTSVKEGLTLAYVTIGGDQAFASWAQENQTEFYKIWSKMLPQDVQHTGTLRLEDILAKSHE